jgi:predicted ATPase
MAKNDNILQASLMARLDRLGSAKQVAQIGAGIGREFSHALLSAVLCKPETELASALDRLFAAGLLFRQGAPPHATYLFKHALGRKRLMAPCYASRDARCKLASPKRWKVNSQRLRRTSQNF